jgi:predicted transcriptional regulator
MTEKVIFNMDTKLKSAAMKKATKQGLSLTTVLTLATQAYVDDALIVGAFEAELAAGREDIKRGRVIPMEKVFKSLNL